MKALGLDPSLTSSGWAIRSSKGGIEWGRFTRGATLRDERRLHYLLTEHGKLVRRFKPDVVVIEGYSFKSVNQGPQLGELGGVLKLWLFEQQVPYVVVPPARLKGFALGKGGGPGTTKAAVLNAAREHLGYVGKSFDEADAVTLASMALVAYRGIVCPFPDEERHTEWAHRVNWPVLRPGGGSGAT